MVVPRLTATPRLKGLAGGSRTRAQLALALLDAEIAPPALWNGHAEAFVQRALAQWIHDRGGDAIARRFEMRAWISRGFGYYTGDADAQPVVLAVEPSSAAYLRLGSAYRYLEQQHPQLPATVARAIKSLNSCIRVYDENDAEEYSLQRSEWLEDEDLTPEAREDLEFPELKLPKSLRRAALRSADAVRFARRWSPIAARVAERAVRLQRLADRFHREWSYEHRMPREVRDELVGDYGMPLPALLAAIEEHDLIHAAFDDESQRMYDEQSEPSQLWLIDPITPTTVRRAFDGLAAWLEVMGAAAALFAALPGQGEYTFDGGVPLADIFAAEDAA